MRDLYHNKSENGGRLFHKQAETLQSWPVGDVFLPKFINSFKATAAPVNLGITNHLLLPYSTCCFPLLFTDFPLIAEVFDLDPMSLLRSRLLGSVNFPTEVEEAGRRQTTGTISYNFAFYIILHWFT